NDIQVRGRLFVGPQEEIYTGMIVGENARPGRRTMLLKKLVRPEVGTVAFGLWAIVALCCAEAGPAELEQTAAPIIMKSVVATAPTIGETSPVNGKVPQVILDPILNEAAALASVDR